MFMQIYAIQQIILTTDFLFVEIQQSINDFQFHKDRLVCGIKVICEHVGTGPARGLFSVGSL